ncbi:MAG: hypothetical protein B6I20_04225 [Bacteroidetes bacterium 4572_117]|nr:MAG: hypothetical protein B6I20_04225 [Bacteroidetes bacterium 4572_117]
MTKHTRRKFVKTIAFSSLLAPISAINISWKNPKAKNNDPTDKILAKSLKKGDTIGLAAPGGFISKAELKEIIVKVEKLGYKAYYRKTILLKEGYFAGSDKQRADELMHMFKNHNVDGILCARGGYGSNRILDVLDYETIKQNPKILVGYSDITSLLVAIYQKTGLVGFHGPVGVSTFNEYTLKSFNKILVEAKSRYKYPYLREKNTENNTDFDKYTITPGKASGELIGGNLVMLTTLIGTKYEADFENKIVFIEEIREKPYKVDRMITHLLMSTNFAKASGIVLGIFNKCDIDGVKLTTDESFTLKEILNNCLAKLNIPCFYGLPFGHVANKITIPVGIIAKMNAGKQSLKLTEAAVLN